MLKKALYTSFAALIICCFVEIINGYGIPGPDPCDIDSFCTCQDIQQIFEDAKGLFQNADDSAELLAKNCLLMLSKMRGGPIFSIDPRTNTDPLTDCYMKSEEVLFGTGLVFEKCIVNRNNPVRPSDDVIASLLRNMTDCLPCADTCPNLTGTCTPPKYRSFNGYCTNAKDPWSGATFTQLLRMVPPCYENYVSDMKKSYCSGNKPSPRLITDTIFTTKILTNISTACTPNVLWFNWCQLFIHDTSLVKNTQQRSGNPDGVRCCSADFTSPLPSTLQHYACSPMEVSCNDSFYGNTSLRCLNFVRAQSICPNDGQVKYREQLNTVTGCLDLSQCYGQTEADSQPLRTFVGGKLRSNNDMLPMLDNAPDSLGQCYLLPDIRGNHVAQIALIESFILKLHNMCAEKLNSANPGGNEETIYQECRRFVIAVWQHISYQELIPPLMCAPCTAMPIYNTTVNRTSYNPNSKCAVTTEYTAAAMRALHKLTPNIINQCSEGGQITSQISQSAAIFQTCMLETNYSSILKGCLLQPIATDTYGSEIRNEIFNGMDLPSFDIQRGRDQGLCSYTSYRKFCNLSDVKSFDDLNRLMKIEHVNLLRNLYKSVKDIDLIVGGVLELSDCIVGPTLRCLIGKQIDNFKYGDPYFYTHKDGANPFTTEQLKVISSFTVAKLICLVTNATSVQKYAFYLPSKDKNPPMNCADLKGFNLSAWKL